VHLAIRSEALELTYSLKRDCPLHFNSAGNSAGNSVSITNLYSCLRRLPFFYRKLECPDVSRLHPSSAKHSDCCNYFSWRPMCISL